MAYFLFRLQGALISKNFATSFLTSSNFLLGPIHAAMYSPSSILHTVVDHRNPVIAQ
jgi:hypothetical protein